MIISLKNCYNNFLKMSIDINEIGAGEKLTEAISSKVDFLSWEYKYHDDILTITTDENTVIPDMSEFGEVIIDDNTIG